MSKAFEQAVFCINQGNLLESLKYFELALKEAPQNQHHVIHCNVGSALLAMDDLPSAVAAFDEALQLSPDHIESLVNRGIANVRMRAYDSALQDYTKATQLSPQFHPALCGKSEALTHLGRFKEAISVAKLACELVPTNPLGFADLGFAYLKSGMFQDAGEQLQISIELGDDTDENRDLLCVALTQRAVELEIQGKRESAWEMLHRVNKLSSLAKNLHNEGILLLALGRNEDAMDCFLLALKRKPAHFEARLALGTLLGKLEYLPDAEFHLSEACAVEPTSVEARFNLGVVKAKQGNSIGAQSEWEFILQRIDPEEPHAIEALRLLALALQDAKAKGSDGRKETMEVANKIADLCNAPKSASNKEAVSPLPRTHLILDDGSGDNLMGMSPIESQMLLQQMDELTNCAVCADTGKRQVSDAMLCNAKEILGQVDRASETVAMNSNSTERLMLQCAKAANLAAVCATNAYAFLDCDNNTLLTIQLVESSCVNASTAMDAAKLLGLAEDMDDVWIESICNSVGESQQVCEQVCKQLLLQINNTPQQSNQVRNLQQVARDGQLRAVELSGGSNHAAIAIPLLITGRDGHTLLGDDAAALQQQMQIVTRNQDNIGDVERGAAVLQGLISNQQQGGGAMGRINRANVAGVTAATAHALAERNPELALKTAKLALECAANTLSSAPAATEDDVDAMHACAVAAMECAEICSSAAATVGDVYPLLRAECVQCEDLAGQVLAKAHEAAQDAAQEKQSPQYLLAAKRIEPMVVPFGSRIATTPTVLTALAFARPRPLVMVHPTTGQVLGVGTDMQEQIDTLLSDNSHTITEHELELGASKLMAAQRDSTDSSAASMASLTGALATHAHYLADTNPQLALQAANTALRTSLASMESLNLDECEVCQAVCRMVMNSSTICSETCAKVLERAQLGSDLWNDAKLADELATRTMKMSLDLSQRAGENKSRQASSSSKQQALVPLVVPFRSAVAALPARFEVQTLRTPRPLIMADPRTGDLMGMSTTDSNALLGKMAKMDTCTQEEREHEAKELMDTAEQSILQAKQHGNADMARNANLAGISAYNAHGLAESNPELAVSTAKSSLRSSNASLEAMLSLRRESTTDCEDLFLSTAQAVMESSAMVSVAMERAKRTSVASNNVAMLAEIEELEQEASKAWDKASEFAKQASQAKLEEDKPVVKKLTAVLVPFPAVVVSGMPEVHAAKPWAVRRTPLVMTDAATGLVLGTTPTQQQEIASWLENSNLEQAAHDLVLESKQAKDDNALHGINVANATMSQAVQIGETNPALAIHAANAALECAQHSLQQLKTTDYAAVAAKMVMDTSAACKELCNKLSVGEELMQQADRAMAEAVDVAITAKTNSRRHTSAIKAIAVPFPATSTPLPTVLQTKAFLTARPLVIVNPYDGALVGVSALESERLFSQMEQLSVINNESIKASTRELITFASGECAGNGNEVKGANVAGIIAAHADALAECDPELAVEAANAALNLVFAASACADPSQALARSALETSTICRDVCNKVLANSAHSNAVLHKKTLECAAQANRASKLAIDLVKLKPTFRARQWNEPVVIPLDRASTPTRAPMLRTASIDTTRLCKDTLAQTQRAAQACEETRDVFGRSSNTANGKSGDARKSLARSCARAAATAAASSASSASLAHRVAEMDPALALQLVLIAMECANKSLDASEDALRGDSLNSDVAYRVSTSTAETARVCLDAARLVLASRSAKTNFALSEQAGHAIKTASELTRRAISKQNDFRVVLGSAAYQEAKARLRRAENVKKRQSMANGLLASRHSSNSKPVVFGQGLLKRTGMLLIDPPSSSSTAFEDVERKLLRTVLQERSDFKDKFAVTTTAAIATVENKIVYKQPGGEDGTFTFAELKTPNCPLGVDPSKKEMYLSDLEFQQVFAGKSKDEFFKFPAWKRTREKQHVGIF